MVASEALRVGDILITRHAFKRYREKVCGRLNSFQIRRKIEKVCAHGAIVYVKLQTDKYTAEPVEVIDLRLGDLIVRTLGSGEVITVFIANTYYAERAAA